MPKMMKQCGLTVASRSDSGVISSSVSESALSASDTAAPNSANFKKLVLQTEFEVCKKKGEVHTGCLIVKWWKLNGSEG